VTRVAARLVVAAVGALAGCSDPVTPAIVAATPGYGPLKGGTRIELAVDGLPTDAPLRVFVGDRAAPLAFALDAATLEIVIPPGDRPGDADILVVAGPVTATASGIFRYSEPPAVDAITPATVLATSTTTEVTVTGRGFLAEGAGDVALLVDGVPVTDVRVESDTTLVFTAPPGRALANAAIRVVDERGVADRERAYRYIPSEQPGLLLFSIIGSSFATYYDPVAGTTVDIPRVGTWQRFTAVTRDERGDYWAVDRGGRFGRLDLHAQDLIAPVQTGLAFPALARIGGAYVGINRFSLRIGTLDPATGGFTQLGTAALQCCGAFGIATDGEVVVLAANVDGVPSIRTLDPTTGELGTPIPIAAWPGFQLEDLRFFAGTLYAVSRDWTIATIDPATGIATSLASFGRYSAMEVYDPSSAPP
jgi:hypothetical protein